MVYWAFNMSNFPSRTTKKTTIKKEKKKQNKTKTKKLCVDLSLYSPNSVAFRTRKLASWLAGHVTSCCMRMTLQVVRRHFVVSSNRRPRLINVGELQVWHLADAYLWTHWFILEFFGSRLWNISGKQSCLHSYCRCQTRKFPVHSPHDIRSRCIIPPSYRGTKVRSQC